MIRKFKRAENAPDEMHGGERDVAPTDDDVIGVEHVGGSSVKGGLHAEPRRAEGRSQEQKVESGERADLDRDRSERAGRHYGRSGSEQPGPRYGRGALQPNSDREK